MAPSSPFADDRLPIPTPAEIHRRLQAQVHPKTIDLTPRERANFLRFKARMDAQRRAQDAAWPNDPITRTWMP